MRLTVHRSSCQLWRGAECYASWEEYRFRPRPMASRESPAGFWHLRTESAEVAVEAPMGYLAGDNPRYQRYRCFISAVGLDATSVHHLARTRQHGFRFPEV